MRIFFAITGQLGYGGLVQQSVILVKYLREFGCDVFTLVGFAPPYNDEVDLDELDYTFEAFNVADYVLRDKPPFVRWLLGWYARHQLAKNDSLKFKRPNNSAASMIEVDTRKVLQDLMYNPDEGAIEKVSKLHRDFKPDIDYACELSLAGYFGIFDGLGTPLVVSAQGYEICQRRGVDMVPLIRANADRIDAVVSGSHANVRENVARDLPFLLPKVHVIPYGIVNDHHYEMSMEEAERRTRKFVQKSDDFTVISLGRMDVEKGVDLALHAIRMLLDEGVRVRLRVVGDWPMNEHYYPVLQEKIGMMDLQDNVDCIGFVESKADKVALLKTSDTMLATFIKSEPFGLVLCEAMAAGIPVISPDTGAGSEILEWNGLTSGVIYRTQDTGQMADRIRYLVDYPEERKGMGRNGALAVQQHFNARRMARDILELFEDLVERRDASRRTSFLKPSAVV